jgi:hypothetical protein
MTLSRPVGSSTAVAVSAIVIAFLLGGWWPGAANAATFTVTTTNNSGTGSLRAALMAANATAGADTIKFAIPGSGAHTIALASSLPVITQPVVIDGRSQPGFSGEPLVQLDNGTGSASAIGLDVTAGASKVLGLSVTRFGIGIRLRGGDGSTVAGCWIGLDSDGARADNATGIAIRAASAANVVGGTTTPARNVISGNGTGVLLSDVGTNGNLIEGDYLGTTLAGTGSLSNFDGIVVKGAASENTIGGTTGAARNVISGNQSAGVAIANSGTKNNVVEGNYVGTDPTGARLGNGAGILIYVAASRNRIGGTSAAARNVISGNVTNGVELAGSGTTGNLVQGNYIGTSVAGTAALDNATNGVALDSGASANTIGGNTAGARNVISGNADNGVKISDSATKANVVAGNFIGVDRSGAKALGNGFLLSSGNGVLLTAAAHGNTIGGLGEAAGNLISGNKQDGVAIEGAGANKNIVEGNEIGTNLAGSNVLPNLGIAEVRVFDGATGNTVGGTSIGAGNVIAGAFGRGVLLDGAATASNVVAGNYIGTDASGGGPLGNADGVVVGDGAHDNAIGGTSVGARNVISGNFPYAGVAFFTAGAGNVVEGNYVGLNAAGTGAVRNGEGINVEFTGGTRIGGTLPGTGNVISGNIVGVSLWAATGTRIEGNRIGPAATGTALLGNSYDGVLMENQSHGNVVGGMSPAARNTIAGNERDGVELYDAGDLGGVDGDPILGNSIFSNYRFGIELILGNDDQPAPTIASVTTSGSTTTIVAALAGVAASTQFRVEFFVNPSCDPWSFYGIGEGETFLGARSITTDPGGNGSASLGVPALPAGEAVTATATNLTANDTSGFSFCGTSS